MRTAVILVLVLASAAVSAAELPRLQDPAGGATVVLDAGQQKALHLVFFATWCPECVSELPKLAELEDSWKSRGYRLVLVAVRSRQEPARLVEFQAEHRPPGRFLFDAFGEAEGRWSPEGLPAHVLLDAQGREIARSERVDGKLEAAISGLLSGSGR